MDPAVPDEPFCRVCMKTSLEMMDFHMQLRDQNHLCTGCADELKNAFDFIRKAEQGEKRIQDSIENLITENDTKTSDDQVLPETVVEEMAFDSETLNGSNSVEEHGDEYESLSSYSLDTIYTDSQNRSRDVRVTLDEKEYTGSCYEPFESCNSNEETPKLYDDMITINFYCKTCNKNFKNHRSLYQHQNRFHQDKTNLETSESSEAKPDSTQIEHHCEICFKTYKSVGLLKTHLRYHERKQLFAKSEACPVCGKCFGTANYLRQHTELVHAVERPQLTCEQCNKIYMTKNALENHKRIHTGQTVQCDECGKSFTTPYDLKIHLRFHARDYPFQCSICDKKFAIKGHLRTHMWRHEGLKLSCEDCGKLFTSTKALTEHSFSHTKEMPYPCQYCNKSYPSKQKFKVHLKTAHNIDCIEMENLKINNTSKRILRKNKLPLVQADSVIKEVEIICKESENSQDSIVEIN